MSTYLERMQLGLENRGSDHRLDLIKKFIQLNGNGSEEAKAEKVRILMLLDEQGKEEEAQLEQLLKEKTEDKRDYILPKSLFPKPNEKLAEGELVELIAFSNDYKERYLNMSKSGDEKSEGKNSQIIKNAMFSPCISDVSLFYAVNSKTDHTYMGYVAIRDISKTVWELSIELLEEYRHKGIGYEALRLLLDKISKISGETIYRSRVYPDNYASQALMKRLGAKPNGISKYRAYNVEIEKFEEENLDLIDEKMIKVADEFNVEPRKLLSHVLEYTIEWTANK